MPADGGVVAAVRVPIFARRSGCHPGGCGGEGPDHGVRPRHLLGLRRSLPASGEGRAGPSAPQVRPDHRHLRILHGGKSSFASSAGRLTCYLVTGFYHPANHSESPQSAQTLA